MTSPTRPLRALAIATALAFGPHVASTQTASASGQTTCRVNIDCENLPCPCSGAAAPVPETPAPAPAPEPQPAPPPSTPANDEPPPTSTTDEHCTTTRRMVTVTLDRRRHRAVLAHIRRAIRAGWPRVLTVNRPGADERRDQLLDDARYPTRPGMDRDEWPMAFARTSWRAHVAYVPARANRSAGAIISNRLRPYCDGTRFRVSGRRAAGKRKALAAALASVAAARNDLLSPNGRIGSVYVDRATTEDVRAAFGAPRSERATIGNRAGVPISITEWRYTCKGSSGSSSFFFDESRVLRNFYSRCRSWETPAGSHVGDRLADVERLERQRVGPGCGDVWTITKRSGRALMGIAFTSERPDAPARSVWVESRRHRVLSC